MDADDGGLFTVHDNDPWPGGTPVTATHKGESLTTATYAEALAKGNTIELVTRM